jgi:hypothetical protein
MKRKILPVAMILLLSACALSAAGDRVVFKIGPVVEIGKYKELSDASLVGAAALGIDLAICCSKRIEIVGSYKFNKKTTPGGHGTYDIFRLDTFAAGLLYKPIHAENAEPFVGIGLDYYHFWNNMQYFIFPLPSALGPYVQAGSYLHFDQLVELQVFVKYNLVKHTEKRSTQWKTYHYRTDFSGLGFGLGILFCVHGK